MDCEPILQPLLNYAEDFTVMEIEDLTSLLNYCVSQADGSNHVSMDTVEGGKKFSSHLCKYSLTA